MLQLRAYLAAVFAAFVLSCAGAPRPRSATPAAVALVHVAMCGLDPASVAVFREALQHAPEAGLLVIESSDCESQDVVRVMPWTFAGCARGATYTPMDNMIRYDARCMSDTSIQRSVALHELLHAAPGRHEFATHICKYPGELPDYDHPDERCSPVGFGAAILNPYYPAHGTALERPTDLDRREVERAVFASLGLR